MTLYIYMHEVILCIHVDTCMYMYMLILTFHHLLQALSHDVDVVDVVEEELDVAVVVCVFIALPRCLVGYGIDLDAYCALH